MITKDSKWLFDRKYDFYIKEDTMEIFNCVLFFSGFSLKDFSKKHALTIHNLSQSLTIRAPSPLQYNEWIEAIKLTMQKGSEFTHKNRFESFAPIREICQASHFIDGQS